MFYDEKVVNIRNTSIAAPVKQTHDINSLFVLKIISFMREGCKILDIGTGNGFVLKQIQENSSIKSTLTGVDNSSKMCQCPQSCFLHFYACNCAFYRNTLIVSMTSVVLSSFLRYPSKNPVKSRLSSLIFAGN